VGWCDCVLPASIGSRKRSTYLGYKVIQWDSPFPAHAAATVGGAVTNPEGQSGALVGGFTIFTDVSAGLDFLNRRDPDG